MEKIRIPSVFTAIFLFFNDVLIAKLGTKYRDTVVDFSISICYNVYVK